MKKMKKTIQILFSMLFVLLFFVPAHADTTTTYNTSPVTANVLSNSTANELSLPSANGQTTSNVINSGLSNNLLTNPYEQVLANTVKIPNVTINQAEIWAQRKGYDIIGLLQKVVQPFAIIIFILGAFLSLFGALGNSQLVGKGIWVMIIAVLLYAVVLSAPQIMNGVLSFLYSSN